MISPFRDFRLVERQTVSNQPIPEVGTIDGTRGNRVSAAIVINGRAYDRTICDEGLKLVRRLYPTRIRDVIRSPAKLAGFRRVDAKQVDAEPWISSASPSTTLACPEIPLAHADDAENKAANHSAIISLIGIFAGRFLYRARHHEGAKNRHRPGCE